jgi:hypothetical protein
MSFKWKNGMVSIFSRHSLSMPCEFGTPLAIYHSNQLLNHPDSYQDKLNHYSNSNNEKDQTHPNRYRTDHGSSNYRVLRPGYSHRVCHRQYHYPDHHIARYQHELW